MDEPLALGLRLLVDLAVEFPQLLLSRWRKRLKARMSGAASPDHGGAAAAWATPTGTWGAPECPSASSPNQSCSTSRVRKSKSSTPA